MILPSLLLHPERCSLRLGRSLVWMMVVSGSLLGQYYYAGSTAFLVSSSTGIVSDVDTATALLESAVETREHLAIPTNTTITPASVKEDPISGKAAPQQTTNKDTQTHNKTDDSRESQKQNEEASSSYIIPETTAMSKEENEKENQTESSSMSTASSTPQQHQQIVTIHSGPHKTSSTALQHFFKHNQKTLFPQHAILSPTTWNIRYMGCQNQFLKLLGIPMRPERPTECPLPYPTNLTQWIHEQHQQRHKHVVISSEPLDSLSAEKLQALIDQIRQGNPHAYIRVVVYYRRWIEWLESSYREWHKTSNEFPFWSWVDWVEQQQSPKQQEAFFKARQRSYSHALTQRWRSIDGVDQVHVLSMHRAEPYSIFENEDEKNDTTNGVSTSTTPVSIQDPTIRFVCEFMSTQLPTSNTTNHHNHPACQQLLRQEIPSKKVNTGYSLEAMRLANLLFHHQRLPLQLGSTKKRSPTRKRVQRVIQQWLNTMSRRQMLLDSSFPYWKCLSESTQQHMVDWAVFAEDALVCSRTRHHSTADGNCFSTQEERAVFARDQRALLQRSPTYCSINDTYILQESANMSSTSSSFPPRSLWAMLQKVYR